MLSIHIACNVCKICSFGFDKIRMRSCYSDLSFGTGIRFRFEISSDKNNLCLFMEISSEFI